MGVYQLLPANWRSVPVKAVSGQWGIYPGTRYHDGIRWKKSAYYNQSDFHCPLICKVGFLHRQACGISVKEEKQTPGINYCRYGSTLSPSTFQTYPDKRNLHESFHISVARANSPELLKCSRRQQKKLHTRLLNERVWNT
jgi:hypothetical protein